MKTTLLTKKPSWLKFLSLACLLLVLPVVSFGQVTMTTTGSYSQDFNTLPSTGTPTWANNSTLANWYAAGFTTFSVGTGSANSGALYSFGVAGVNALSDRALGGVGSGSANPAYGVVLRNTSGGTITDIKVTYTGEQWRNGGVTATQPLSFYYAVSASAITSVTAGASGYTAVPALNFTSKVGTTTAAALDGNAAANRTVISNVSIPSLSLPNNSYIILKWDDINDSGNDHGLGIDDVTISWTVTPSVVAPTVTNTAAADITTNSATLAGNVTATGGAAITATGSVYALTSVDNTPTIGEANVTNLATSTPGSGTGTFSNATGTGLAVNTQYSYNAYATNSIGTSYGTVATFYTLAVTPDAPVVGSPTTSSLTVILDTSDANPSGTEYAIQEAGGAYVQANGSLGVSPVWRNETAWGTITVTGLSSATQYTFQVKARNGNAVETLFGASASATTNANSSPTIEADTLTDFGALCLNTSATNSFGFIGYNLTTADVTVGPLAGYTFSTSLNGTYTASLSFTPDVNGEMAETVYVKFTPTAVGSYNGLITITGGGVSTAVNVSASGSGINTPVTAITGASASVTATTAVLNGSFTAGCSTVTASGIEYSVNNDFSASATVAFGGTVSSLSPNTTYYFRAFATDATGTVNGNSANFTTANLSGADATAATNVGTGAFTANWVAVPGATGYRLDVGTSSDFSGPVTVLANWSFPNNPDDNVVDVAESGNANKTLTTQGGVSGTIAYAPVQSSTTSAASVSGWDGGNNTKFWQIDIATLGYSNLKLSSAQRSSNTGPKDFKVQYKIGSGSWTDVPGATVTVANNWTTGALSDVALPAACNNQASVLIRWIMTSNLQVSTGNVASTGTSGIDNILVNGQAEAFVSGYQNLSVGNVTSYPVSGLTSNTTYYYRVRATSANSTSANSDVISVTTEAILATFDAVTQAAFDCNATSFALSGLTPGANTIYYTLNGTPSSTFVFADSNGEATLDLPLTNVNNGQTLAITAVELFNTPASNVTVAPSASSSIAVVVTPTVTPGVSLTSSDADNTFAYGTGVTFTASASNLSGGTATYTFTVNGQTVQSGSSNTYTSSTLANGNQVRVSISIAGGSCLTATTANSNVITNTVTGAYLTNITNFCGLTMPAIDSRIKCSVPSGVVGTLGYRFRVTNLTTNATATVDSNIANFNLTMTNIYAFGTS
ncbi:beta strand repeat-containing protein, partial [Flavobacterium cheonhonense]